MFCIKFFIIFSNGTAAEKVAEISAAYFYAEISTEFSLEISTEFFAGFSADFFRTGFGVYFASVNSYKTEDPVNHLHILISSSHENLTQERTAFN